MDVLAPHAARQPDTPLVIEGERRVTWAEFVAARNRLAHGLVAREIRPGDHVAIHGLNSVENLLAAAGVRAVGAVPGPVNHRLVADAVAYILDDSDAVAVFVGDAFLPVAEVVRPRAPRVRHWVLLEEERPPWAEALAGLLAGGDPGSLPAGVEPAVGTYYICDRKRDMIISGGVNIYPERSANILLGMQTLVAREVPAQETAVMTVGQIVSGTKGNIIPDTALCAGRCGPTRRRCESCSSSGWASTPNTSAGRTGRRRGSRGGRVVSGLREPRAGDGLRPPVRRGRLGAAAVEEGERAMPSDDMGLFLQARPGCYFRVGIQPTDGRPHPHHAPEFEMNEDGLGAGLRVALAVMRRALAPPVAG